MLMEMSPLFVTLVGVIVGAEITRNLQKKRGWTIPLGIIYLSWYFFVTSAMDSLWIINQWPSSPSARELGRFSGLLSFQLTIFSTGIFLLKKKNWARFLAIFLLVRGCLLAGRDGAIGFADASGKTQPDTSTLVLSYSFCIIIALLIIRYLLNLSRPGSGWKTASK